VTANRSDPLLEIQDLTISYRLPDDGVLRVIDRLSFSVSNGESIAIVGESGCGKSTLALAIMGMLPANAIISGAIRHRGTDLLVLPEGAMERIRGDRISMIFQQPQMALHPLLRAGKQVAEVIRAHHRWSHRRCRLQARAVLERVFDYDLDRVWEQYPHELSGGECQRVCIAQALACNPDLLIADEPTAMLDAVVQATVLRILHELARTSNLSLMLITHNLALLPGLTDRTIALGSCRTGPAANSRQSGLPHTA
jgi:ABC-type glutathione transport system ATPase component